MFRTVLILIFFTATALGPVSARSQKAMPKGLLISHSTRLMVFSPHPDDATLGAGGVIQRVLKAGGKVRVVYMTNGDGFPEGVEMEDHISIPTAGDYRRYGVERREEALKATAALGMKATEVSFLGFPDGGLAAIHAGGCTHKRPYRSPFTEELGPPVSEVIVPRTDYCGGDLTDEIERLFAGFRPDLVATTPAQDQHPDHNATYLFVKEALKQWDRKHPNHKPEFITFLIHYGQWPVAQGSGAGSHLYPPKGFPTEGIEWVSFALKPDEVEIKRKAILEYRSQMLVMGRFLMSFARSNELFILDK